MAEVRPSSTAGAAADDAAARSVRTPDPAIYDAFMARFARDHNRLFAYILTFVPDRVEAEEVFQDASLVLWREFASFDQQCDFLPWARAVCFNQIRRYWRRRDRHQRMIFSEGLLASLAEQEQQMSDELETRRMVLSGCLAKLRERDRELIELYYGTDATAQGVGKQLGRSIFAVRKAIKRIRRQLFACVDQKLAGEAGA